jgi:hypothetical protein
MPTLAELMKKGGSAPPTPAKPAPAPAAEELELELEKPPAPHLSSTAAPVAVDLPRVLVEGSPFASVEIDAVILGVLMKVCFSRGVTPAEAIGALRAIDAAAKFRDDFPSKPAFGKRETKIARALVLNVDVRESGKFVSITATTGSDDLSIVVGKKIVDEWLGKVSALGKLTDRNVEKIRAAYEVKKSATIVLGESEQFGVRYWTTDDGKAFLDEMVAEPPPAAEGGAE